MNRNFHLQKAINWGSIHSSLSIIRLCIVQWSTPNFCHLNNPRVRWENPHCWWLKSGFNCHGLYVSRTAKTSPKSCPPPVSIAFSACCSFSSTPCVSSARALRKSLQPSGWLRGSIELIQAIELGSKYGDVMWISSSRSMDWFKGKSAGNHGFYH